VAVLAALGSGYLTGLAAAAMGQIAAGWVAASRRVAGPALAALAAIGVMTGPLVPVHVAPPEAVVRAWPDMPTALLHRLYIWSFTAERITEQPWRGWGMNASRALPGGNDDIGRVEGHVEQPVLADRLPLHPHNAALQAWVELGVIGAAALAGIAALAMWVASHRRLSRSAAALASGQTACALAMAASSYGLWQSWWLLSLGLATAVSVAVLSETADPG